jgi:hypothetical protein
MNRPSIPTLALVLVVASACAARFGTQCTDEQLALAAAHGYDVPAAQAQAASAERPARELSELEADFAKLLTGAKLVGSFTEDSTPDLTLQKDSYTISKAEKLESGKWKIEALMEYGERKITVPLVLDVEWAGDTPVITVDDLAVPMVGTYTARVLFLGERYVGIWYGSDHGGHMLGRVERADAAALEAATPAKSEK